jgi:hypothetical protein
MARPAVERRMPYKTDLELFGPVALAYLMDGPKPQPVLDGHVPVSVLEHLSSAGMIERKMVRKGSLATAWWYMAGDESPGPSAKHLRRCDDPGIFDGMQEAGLPD